MAGEPKEALPLTESEVDALLAPLESYGHLILAVSGGADSTALMHLASDWSQRRGAVAATIIAATVDHGLRPESATEAAAVAQQASRLGLRHCTLRWKQEKPSAGIQAAAREARYSLLFNAATQASLMQAACRVAGAIVTAHTADDQAETLVMRLMRGSGVDGLAAIPAIGWVRRPLPTGEIGAVPVIRPLLGIARARLVATLGARGIAFSVDPSNSDRRFERVRVREALGVLDGLGLTRAALTRTAARMQAARDALDESARQIIAASVTSPLAGVYAFDATRVQSAPGEIAMRVLRRVLAQAGGAAPPAELGAIEDACRRLQAEGEGRSFTLAGCVVETGVKHGGGSVILVYREPDRDGGLPVCPLAPCERRLWDGRFWVSVSPSHTGLVEVGPLGDDWSSVAIASPILATRGIPAGAVRGLPAFRQAGRLMAVPGLAALALALGDAATATLLMGPLEPKSQGDKKRPIFEARLDDDRNLLSGQPGQVS